MATSPMRATQDKMVLARYDNVRFFRQIKVKVMDRHTMYDFHNSTDTLKFGTKKRAINKTFFFFN